MTPLHADSCARPDTVVIPPSIPRHVLSVVLAPFHFKDLIRVLSVKRGISTICLRRMLARFASVEPIRRQLDQPSANHVKRASLVPVRGSQSVLGAIQSTMCRNTRIPPGEAHAPHANAALKEENISSGVDAPLREAVRSAPLDFQKSKTINLYKRTVPPRVSLPHVFILVRCFGHCHGRAHCGSTPILLYRSRLVYISFMPHRTMLSMRYRILQGELHWHTARELR